MIEFFNILIKYIKINSKLKGIIYVVENGMKFEGIWFGFEVLFLFVNNILLFVLCICFVLFIIIC